MIPLSQLWLPIVLSAVAVFVVSSLIHMVFKWHNTDYRPLPNEEAVRAALREAGSAPGMYVVPHCDDMKEMGSEAMQAKYKEGPVGMLFLRPAGPMTVGPSLAQWFLLSLAISAVIAHLMGTVSHPGENAHLVFHFTAILAFLAYGTGSIIAGIWMGQPWKAVAKDLLDAALYGAATGAVFMWQWPK